MSCEEDFLKRWSRRKREVAEAEKPKPPAPAADAKAAPEPAKAAARAEPAFDPASLPPIDSINELSDVTAFLRAGVPADLTRAALRRVWAADPAIREFVGLAENSWDFTDPDAIPGFGPLEDSEAVRRMIAQVVDQIGKSSPPVDTKVHDETTITAEESNVSNEILAVYREEHASCSIPITDEIKQRDAEDLGDRTISQSSINAIATQHRGPTAVDAPKPTPPRRHGRALPM